MTSRILWLILVSALAVGACQSPTPTPAVLDTRNEACRFCRMVVSDQRFASQIVAPNEEPRFFDDLGCLEHFLSATPLRSRGLAVYVADHRTKAWVKAETAVYTRVDATAPMGSHFIAHESVASRDADAAAAGGHAVSIADVLPALQAGLHP